MAGEFIASISGIYNFAFLIYRKHLSTTARPSYKKGPFFRLVHLVDPHLMCIPSLHAMLMIHSYTSFRNFIRRMGEEAELAGLIEKIFCGAVVITEAVLYVKQHSINCIAASLFAMNHYTSGSESHSLFDASLAESFLFSLFRIKDIPPEYAAFYKEPFTEPENISILHKEMLTIYRNFQKPENKDWIANIVRFLESCPLK